MRQPCCHIAAIGHAFVLFDFLCGFLSKVGIGNVGKKVADEVTVDGFMGVDVFRCHSADLPDRKPQFIAPHAFRNDICIVAIVTAARADSCIYWIGVVAETNEFLVANAAA